jgi:hypothetical protein
LNLASKLDMNGHQGLDVQPGVLREPEGRVGTEILESNTVSFNDWPDLGLNSRASRDDKDKAPLALLVPPQLMARALS